MIQRRTLLKTSAAAAALTAPALSGFAQQAVTLKFHTFMPAASDTWLDVLKPWMAKVEKESGGRINFEAYPAMQLGGTPVQLYDQAKDGVVDVVWTLPGTTAGRFPRIEVFELPFMMSNVEATSKAYWEYVQTVAPDEFKDTQVLALHVHGPGIIHTVNPVKSIADMSGLKIRAPTRQVTKLMGILGAIPVGMPLPSIPDALSNRGNTIFTLSAAEAQQFRRKSRTVEVEWVEDMNKKGFDGKKMLDTARSLIEKHTKTTKA